MYVCMYACVKVLVHVHVPLSYLGGRPGKAPDLATSTVKHVDKHLRHASFVVLPLPEEIVPAQVPAINEIGGGGHCMGQILLDGRRAL